MDFIKKKPDKIGTYKSTPDYETHIVGNGLWFLSLYSIIDVEDVNIFSRYINNVIFKH